jgi:DNA-binding HxlR family transcriptional regulator
VLHRTYDGQVCSVARTLELVGDRWTLLIIRDAMLGRRRFDDFQQSLGLARNVLSDRLARLVEAGILRRVRYQERPERYEYRLSTKGRELQVPLIALMQWGDRHLATGGPPRLVEHAGCGGDAVAQLVCSDCGAELGPGEVHTRPGPGFRPQAVASPS